MRLHDLKPAPGSHRGRKRVGRGNGSGRGTTAGKGTKGEKARSGGLKAGFRGMSSRNQRLAKRPGFTNIFKVTYDVINLERLSQFEAGSTVNPTTLVAAGLVDGKAPIKILGSGDVNVPLRLEGVRVSSSARGKIEAAGGAVQMSEPEAEEAAPESAPLLDSGEEAHIEVTEDNSGTGSA